MFKKNLSQFKNEDWMSTGIGLALITLIIAFPTFIPVLPKTFAGPETWRSLGGLFLLAFASTALGVIVMGDSLRGFTLSFAAIFMISAFSLFICSLEVIKNMGLESVFFSVAIGLLIRNTVGLPKWMSPAVRSEYYIKIGLILLGTSVLFGEILKAGFIGIIQAIVVVFVVWYFTFWLARKMKIDDEMGAMLASAVSICGVSAAIATCGAIKGDSKKLSIVVSIVLVVAIPMMYLMPLLARVLGLSPEVAGAWLGGTIDTTGAVVASGKFLGEITEMYSVIIKSSQNVLLGFAAFIISVYWSFRDTNRAGRPTARILWDRFPKFVLGFVLASLIFSLCFSLAEARALGKLTKGMREIMFSVAFVCIGLETDFRFIFKAGNRKYITAFLAAQGFNIVVTLIVATLLFDWFAG